MIFFVHFSVYFYQLRILSQSYFILCYDIAMKNIKENNIRKTLWHIKRHCKNIENNHESEDSKTELFHLKSSIEILSRILNNEKPYPNLDRDEVF